MQPYNPKIAETILVWALSTSLAATTEITIVFFSCAYLDVSVQRVRFHCWMTYLQYARFPHSDICGSNRICQSPQLFAAYHVFLRLWEPRHSLCALSNLLLSLVLSTYYSTSINSNMSKNFVDYIKQFTVIYTYLKKKWRISESNRWPPACKAGALASWANPPMCFEALAKKYISARTYKTIERHLSLKLQMTM